MSSFLYLIAPDEPRIVNLTLRSADVSFVEWHLPSIYYRRVDFYMVTVDNDKNFATDDAKILNTSETHVRTYSYRHIYT